MVLLRRLSVAPKLVSKFRLPPNCLSKPRRPTVRVTQKGSDPEITKNEPEGATISSVRCVAISRHCPTRLALGTATPSLLNRGTNQKGIKNLAPCPLRSCCHQAPRSFRGGSRPRKEWISVRGRLRARFTVLSKSITLGKMHRSQHCSLCKKPCPGSSTKCLNRPTQVASYQGPKRRPHSADWRAEQWLHCRRWKRPLTANVTCKS